MIDSNPKYDAFLEWTITERCNLKCEYCWFIVGRKKETAWEIIKRRCDKALNIGPKAAIQLIWEKWPGRGSKSEVRLADPLPSIDTEKLGRHLAESERIFLISLAGGEPFLVPNVIQLCQTITVRHFLGFSSNLTSVKFKEFASVIDPSKVTFINASCHIKELERTQLTERWIDNFLRCKSAGFPISASVRAYPPLLPEVEKYRDYFGQRGVKLRFGMFVGPWNGVHYPESYTEDELRRFDLESEVSSFHSSLGKWCNAGYNWAVVSPQGLCRPCEHFKWGMGSIYEGIQFQKDMVRCPVQNCSCPFWLYHNNLFLRALDETGRQKATDVMGK